MPLKKKTQSNNDTVLHIKEWESDWKEKSFFSFLSLSLSLSLLLCLSLIVCLHIYFLTIEKSLCNIFNSVIWPKRVIYSMIKGQLFNIQWHSWIEWKPHVTLNNDRISLYWNLHVHKSIWYLLAGFSQNNEYMGWLGANL